MSLELEVPDPGTTDFDRWACELTAQLSSYNVPNPWTEDLWVPWALRVGEVDVIAELGVADPRTFADWRGWGRALLSALT